VRCSFKNVRFQKSRIRRSARDGPQVGQFNESAGLGAADSMRMFRTCTEATVTETVAFGGFDSVF
jgi:hypothetical protein